MYFTARYLVDISNISYSMFKKKHTVNIKCLNWALWVLLKSWFNIFEVCFVFCLPHPHLVTSVSEETYCFDGTRMTAEMKEGKRREKNEKRQWKTREKRERERGRRRRAKYRGACQCGGLMAGVPRLRAISLCYQVKWLCKYDNKSQWKSIWEEATVSHW